MARLVRPRVSRSSAITGAQQPSQCHGRSACATSIRGPRFGARLSTVSMWTRCCQPKTTRPGGQWKGMIHPTITIATSTISVLNQALVHRELGNPAEIAQSHVNAGSSIEQRAQFGRRRQFARLPVSAPVIKTTGLLMDSRAGRHPLPAIAPPQVKRSIEGSRASSSTSRQRSTRPAPCSGADPQSRTARSPAVPDDVDFGICHRDLPPRLLRPASPR